MSENKNIDLFLNSQQKQLERILTSYIFVTYPSYFELIVKSHANYLKNIVFFLKYDSLHLFKTLVDIIAIDEPGKPFRFTIVYCLLSTHYNQRIQIIVQTNELLSIDSISSLFPNALWSEREIWDLYGISFLNHPDLRRILTDYGFEGFPLRKDFPLTGYKEITYSDTYKCIKYDKVELTQAFRNYKYFNPWSKLKFLDHFDYAETEGVNF